MVNLFKDSMDPTLANAGNIIEPKIRDYVQDELNIRYTSYEPSVVK
ncbi:hypothetical protein FACS189496_3990 [Bacilli bacterium]|nr:hypothetical protein FACS189496_3990 [Bacilli bacterium]